MMNRKIVGRYDYQKNLWNYGYFYNTEFFIVSIMRI